MEVMELRAQKSILHILTLTEPLEAQVVLANGR